MVRAPPDRPDRCRPQRIALSMLPTPRCPGAGLRHFVTYRALPVRAVIRQFRSMNQIASIEKPVKPVKERKVSKRVLHAIDLLVSGQCRTQKDAAEKAGLTRERFCRALKESHVIGRLELAVKRQLATSAAPAAGTLLTLLTEAKSEHVRKDCAQTILGMNGIHATGERGPLVSIGIGGGPGYILDLRIPGGGRRYRTSALPAACSPAARCSTLHRTVTAVADILQTGTTRHDGNPCSTVSCRIQPRDCLSRAHHFARTSRHAEHCRQRHLPGAAAEKNTVTRARTITVFNCF